MRQQFFYLQNIVLVIKINLLPRCQRAIVIELIHSNCTFVAKTRTRPNCNKCTINSKYLQIVIASTRFVIKCLLNRIILPATLQLFYKHFFLPLSLSFLHKILLLRVMILQTNSQTHFLLAQGNILQGMFVNRLLQNLGKRRISSYARRYIENYRITKTARGICATTQMCKIFSPRSSTKYVAVEKSRVANISYQCLFVGAFKSHTLRRPSHSPSQNETRNCRTNPLKKLPRLVKQNT